MDNITYFSLDVHNATVAVALAESGGGGEIRQLGVCENRPESLRELAARLCKGSNRLGFCYLEGPCGCGLHRLLTGCGHDHTLLAPSRIPIKAENRVKIEHRDVLMPGKLHRHELMPIWICNTTNEANARLGAGNGGWGAVQSTPASAKFSATPQPNLVSNTRSRLCGCDEHCGRGRRLSPLGPCAAVDYLPQPRTVRAFLWGMVGLGKVTKAGNVLVCRILIEGAWTYRMPAGESRELYDRSGKLRWPSATLPRRATFAYADVIGASPQPANREPWFPMRSLTSRDLNRQCNGTLV